MLFGYFIGTYLAFFIGIFFLYFKYIIWGGRSKSKVKETKNGNQSEQLDKTSKRSRELSKWASG